MRSMKRSLKKFAVVRRSTSVAVVKQVNKVQGRLLKLKPSKQNGLGLFYSTAGILSLAALLYFGLIASDIYISETKFLVRTADKKSSAPVFGEILQQMGFADSQADSWVVHDYMRSQDVMQQLNEIFDIRQLYSDTKIDFFSRFPGIKFWDKSLEAFHDYYQKNILLNIDPVSSIITLKVKGFQADTVLNINQKLLEFSEGLINRLNNRAQEDLIKIARNEINIATDYITDVSTKITKLRQSLQLSDPEGQALQLQRLNIEKSLADQQLTMAMSSLQKAQAETLKQKLYIVKITNPTLPDAAVEPYKIQGIISMILLGLLIWGVISLFISSIKEHHS